MYLTSFGWQTGSRQVRACRKGRKSLRVRYVRGERGCSKPVEYPIMPSLSVSFNQSIEAYYGECVTFSSTKPCGSSEQVSMPDHFPSYLPHGMIRRLAEAINCVDIPLASYTRDGPFKKYPCNHGRFLGSVLQAQITTVSVL